MAESFYFSGGYFDGSSKGFIGEVILELTDSQPRLSYEIKVTYAPDDISLHVPNKGFTGLSIYGDRIWVCHSNQIVSFDANSYEVVTTINDPLFNDLHHIDVDEDGITVVNTGLESLDLFSFDGKLRDRTYFSSVEITNARIDKYSDFRTAKTDPHFFHANHSYKKSDGKRLITFLRQRRVVDVGNWEWASPELPAPLHDGFLADYKTVKRECLWLTTVAGLVYAINPDTFVVEGCWNLVELGVAPGWTRGLSVMEHGFLVATTQIQPSTRAYYEAWTEEDLRSSITSLAYVPFSEDIPVTSMEVLSGERAKVFSVTRNPRL